MRRAHSREIGNPGGGIRRPGFPISHAISLPRANGPPASSDMSYWSDAQVTEVVRRELWKGDDFGHTGIASALMR